MSLNWFRPCCAGSGLLLALMTIDNSIPYQVLVSFNFADSDILPLGAFINLGGSHSWLRPGAVRVDASSDKARVLATALRDPPNGRLVVAAVNNEPTQDRERSALSHRRGVLSPCRYRPAEHE